jgi:hypothetical protein
MQLTPVESSNLKGVHYDPNTQALTVQFHTGGMYRYEQVPVSIYDDLMKAPSKGKFFIQKIRTTYQFSKIS